MEQAKPVVIFGVVITPDFPEEYATLVRAYVEGVQLKYGDVSFLVSSPKEFETSFYGLDDYTFVEKVEGNDVQGRVINNDHIATHCEEAAIFFTNVADMEISVFQMKMRSQNKPLTKFGATLISPKYDEDIPF